MFFKTLGCFLAYVGLAGNTKILRKSGDTSSFKAL